MTLPDVSRLASLPVAASRALGKRLRDLGVTEAEVFRFRGPSERVVDPRRDPLRRWNLRRIDDPRSFALRMFVFRDAITEQQARAALDDVSLEALVEVGLVERTTSGTFVSPLCLSVLDGDEPTYVFSDYLFHGGDAVMGAGGTTRLLVPAAMPSARVDRALDVGCGAGTLALMLSRRCRHVVAVDINPRALIFGRFNAIVAGIENVEFREGDLFSPVLDGLFDLVVSQPPFVAQPQGLAHAPYQIGGSRGDELALRLHRELPPHVAEGGRAVILAQWPIVEGDPLEARILGALASPHLSLLLVFGLTSSLDHHCMEYAALDDPLLGREFEHKAIARREHLDRLHVSGTMMCAEVIVRANDGAPSGWVHSLEAPRITEGIVRSERIDRIVAACDLLAAGDDAIAGASLRIVAGTTFVTPAAGEDVRHDVEARMPASSLAGVLGLNKQSHELLLSIDAFPDVRAAAQALADRVGVPVAVVLAKIIPAVGHALRAGVLEVSR